MHAVVDRQERIDLITKTYVDRAEQTLVVSPDNQSREEINQRIHNGLKSRGEIEDWEHRLTILVSRQELTGADRQWASQYELGDIVRYTRDSKSLGVRGGEYARVAGIDRDQNLLTVERANGAELTYDPRRLHGVNVYKEAQRDFSEGERVQFTGPYREDRIANRQLGTVGRIDSDNNIQIRLDSGRDVQFDGREHLHLDYGYAVTSHSSQGLTADRVLLHVDTEQANERLINTRLAYVAISRGRYDAQVYTNDAIALTDGLSREVSKRSALESGAEEGSREQNRFGHEKEPGRNHQENLHQGQSQSPQPA